MSLPNFYAYLIFVILNYSSWNKYSMRFKARTLSSTAVLGNTVCFSNASLHWLDYLVLSSVLGLARFNCISLHQWFSTFLTRQRFHTLL